MKTYLNAASILVAIVLINGCSSSAVRQRYRDLEVAQNIKLDGWSHAITESRSLCKQTPAQCQVRIIKLTGEVSREDDWYPLLLPPYSKTVEFYEVYLREKSPKVLPMDERFLSELKIMAYLADQGVIAQGEVRKLTTSALRNLRRNILAEAQGLAYEYNAALQSDAVIYRSIMIGLAAGVVATAAAAPIYTLPTPTGIQTFTITDYSHKGRMINCTSTPQQITCF